MYKIGKGQNTPSIPTTAYEENDHELKRYETV